MKKWACVLARALWEFRENFNFEEINLEFWDWRAEVKQKNPIYMNFWDTRRDRNTGYFSVTTKEEGVLVKHEYENIGKELNEAYRAIVNQFAKGGVCNNDADEWIRSHDIRIC